MEQIDPATPFPKGADYLPVVLVRKNLEAFARANGIRLTREEDDLDAYSVAWLRLTEKSADCNFLLMHHAGADENTFDIYLPTNASNPTECLLDILRELRLESREVVIRQLSESAFRQRRSA